VYPRPGPSEWRTFGMADRYPLSYGRRRGVQCSADPRTRIISELLSLYASEPLLRALRIKNAQE